MNKLLVNGCATILAVAAFQVAAAEEVLFVDWDGSGTEGQQALSTDGIPKKISSEAYNLTFDESADWKPLEGYNPPTDKTGNFGLAISSSMGRSPAAPQLLRLDQRGSVGTLTVMTQGSEGEPPQMRGLLFFTKNYFLNGAQDPSAKIHFDAMSRLYFMGILDGVAPEARWIIRDGENWYISEETLPAQMSYNVSEPRELIDPNSKHWALYNVLGAPLDEGPTQFETVTFSDVTAVGIFWNSYGSSNVIGGTSISRMAVDAFSAQAQK